MEIEKDKVTLEKEWERKMDSWKPKEIVRKRGKERMREK